MIPSFHAGGAHRDQDGAPSSCDLRLGPLSATFGRSPPAASGECLERETFL